MTRRIFTAFLCLIILLSCFACGKDGKKSGGEKTPEPTIKSWAFHSFEKTVVNVVPRKELSTNYKVYMTQGEIEGCQVAVYSDTAIKNVTLTMKSGETELIKPALYSMDRAHNAGRKEYTDSLIPYYGKRLQLEKGRVLPFMIEFTTTKDTPAGDYEYVYELKDKDKNVLATYNITVHVWDISLPEDKTFASAAGMDRSFVTYFNGDYADWYEAALQHNISVFVLPCDILSDEADKYMSDPRVTAFQLTIPENEDGTIDEETLLARYEKLKTNSVWLEKAFFWPIDEPRTPEHLVELRDWEEYLSALCPEVDVCAPFYTNIQLNEGKDQLSDMEEYTTLWCPKLCLWDDSQSYDKFLNYKPDKSFADRIAYHKAGGDRVWTYVCNSPDDPYAQLFIDTEGVNQRLLFWQIYQRDIEGFLYWSINSYGYKEGPDPWAVGDVATRQNPWNTVNTKITNGEGQTIYGCGFLFYPGYDVGYDGAVPSIRAKIVRDGVDDIELFYLAEKYLGKEWLVNKTKEGTPTLTEYVSGDRFASLRIEIGNALEAEMKK